MSKFNVGDTVRRTGCACYDIVHGGIYTVERNRHGGIIVLCESSSTRGYDPDLFVLVQAAPQPRSNSDYKINKVLVKILRGQALQYRRDGEWVDLLYPNAVTVNELRQWEFRNKPETVNINGKEITKPKRSHELESYTKYFTFDEGINRVVQVETNRFMDGRLFWESKDDAEVALKAIIGMFK